MGSKISVLTLALMMGATSLFAEDNGKAIDYYKVGMYGEAKKELLANLQSGKTDKAEVCYYLGELYSAQNMKDSAAYYYKEGIVADPDYVLNSIGELKLDLANNPNADKAFSGFLTGKNKKNPAVYIAIARAYLPVSTAKAMEYMEQARAVAPKETSWPLKSSTAMRRAATSRLSISITNARRLISNTPRFTAVPIRSMRSIC